MPEFTAAYRQTGFGVWTSVPMGERFFYSLEEYLKFHMIIGLPINNEFVHAKFNGAFIYVFKFGKESYIANVKRVLKLRRAYKINNSFVSYVLYKFLGLIKSSM